MYKRLLRVIGEYDVKKNTEKEAIIIPGANLAMREWWNITTVPKQNIYACILVSDTKNFLSLAVTDKNIHTFMLLEALDPISP